MERFAAQLSRSTVLTKDTSQMDFTWIKEAVPYQAGQFFLLEVEDHEPKVTRAYSVSSPPSTPGGFSLCLKFLPQGRASEYLKNMPLETEVHFQGPFGHFILSDSPKDIVMVATGTGIAPFMAMIPTLFEQGRKQPIALYFGVRYEEDLFYMDELHAWEQEHPNFKVYVTVSRPNESWQELKGRVTDHLKDLIVKDSEIYICGNGDMVKSVKEMMEGKGVPKENLHFELFTAI